MSYEILSLGGEQTAAGAAAEEANNNGTNANLSNAPEGTETQTPNEGTEGTEVTEGTEGTEGTGTEEGKPEEKPEEGFFWGDVPVEIEVPEDIKSAFDEKGLDAQAVVAELFAKDGKFSLSDETRAKLDEAFGKPLVDGYLNLYKQQNEMAIKDFQSQAEAQKAQLEANTNEFTELVGGDEGFSELDAWAAENLSESELASINAVMTLPPEHWQAQKAMLQALQIKRDAAIREAEGDSSVTLIGDAGDGSGKPAVGLPQTLTRAEFQQEMFSERYLTDPAYADQIDAIRQRSAEQGIL